MENQVSVEDLALHKEKDSWVSCLGFVLETNSWFSSHKGRDITTRVGLTKKKSKIDDIKPGVDAVARGSNG